MQEREEIEAIWVRPRKAVQIAGFGMSRLYQMIADGTLETRKIGGLRLISVASIRALGTAPSPLQPDDRPAA